VSKPRVAFVGWRLGGELERVIEQGRDRFDFTVVSMDLHESLRPLVDWHRMPRPRFGSFRLGWAAFFALGGLRVRRLDADLVHTVGPMPVVPNRVDLNTVTFCHAAYDEATAATRSRAAPARSAGDSASASRSASSAGGSGAPFGCSSASPRAAPRTCAGSIPA
jgi:hypothetical protein